MNEFKIQTYGKSELAMMYMPHLQPASALRTLNNWIGRNAELQQALKKAGWTVKTHMLTPRQVGIITEYLGEP